MKLSIIKGRILIIILAIIAVGIPIGLVSLMKIAYILYTERVDISENKFLSSLLFLSLPYSIYLFTTTYKLDKETNYFSPSHFDFKIKHLKFFAFCVLFSASAYIWQGHLYFEYKRSRSWRTKNEEQINTKKICNWHLSQLIREIRLGNFNEEDMNTFYGLTDKERNLKIKNGSLSFNVLNYVEMGEDPIIEYKEVIRLKKSIITIKRTKAREIR
jgi:hypothetical protein